MARLISTCRKSLTTWPSSLRRGGGRTIGYAIGGSARGVARGPVGVTMPPLTKVLLDLKTCAEAHPGEPVRVTLRWGLGVDVLIAVPSPAELEKGAVEETW